MIPPCASTTRSSTSSWKRTLTPRFSATRSSSSATPCRSGIGRYLIERIVDKGGTEWNSRAKQQWTPSCSTVGGFPPPESEIIADGVLLARGNNGNARRLGSEPFGAGLVSSCKHGLSADSPERARTLAFVLAMQKVEGSSPFIRFKEKPRSGVLGLLKSAAGQDADRLGSALGQQERRISVRPATQTRGRRGGRSSRRHAS